MIRGYLVGDKETVARLDRLKGSLRGKVKQSIVALTLSLLVKVKAEKLTGQVLKVRTGRLRRSVTQRVTDAGTKIHGIVGTNVEYGRLHELGFHGQVSVKAHLRHLRKQSKMSLTTVKGHDMRVWTKQRGGLTGGVAQVRAHTRNVDMPERSFLRSALREMEPKIRDEIRAALQTEFRGM